MMNTTIERLQNYYGFARSKDVSFTLLKLGVYNAVLNFIIVRKAAVILSEKINTIPGIYTLQSCSNMNKKR